MVGVDSVDVADPQAGVGFDVQLVAGLCAEGCSHPRGHTACAVAADLSDGAVGIVQPNAARSGDGLVLRIFGLICPGEELDAVGADAGIARTETAGEACPIVDRQRPLR